MNYLSHYYFDQEKMESSFILGAVFPDLLSNFDRKLKNIPKQNVSDQSFNCLSDFREGIKRHYELDRLFHSGVFFKKETLWLSKEIKGLELKSLNHRIYFFSHILLELILDRILLDRFPNIGHQFYEKLEKTPKTLLKEYFRTQDLLPYHDEFVKYFNFFIEKRFINNYIENVMIISVLDKFHQLINKREIDAIDKEKLNDQMPNWLNHFESIDFDSILLPELQQTVD